MSATVLYMSVSLDGFIAGPKPRRPRATRTCWSTAPEPRELALAAGVLDELELHVIPVLFGQGRRLFEGLAPEQIELERTRVLEGESGVIHMHYRVRR